MKTTTLFLLATLLWPEAEGLFGQDTAFTYQGLLTDNGNPAQGTYDLRFRLYDDVTFGSQVGVDVMVAPAGVSNGLFTVLLDFGASAFNGAACWLYIGVRTNGSVATHTSLAPRYYGPLTPLWRFSKPFVTGPNRIPFFNEESSDDDRKDFQNVLSILSRT